MMFTPCWTMRQQWILVDSSGTDNGSHYTLDNFTISVSAEATSGTTNLNLLQDSVSEPTIIIDIASVSRGDSASERNTEPITLVDDEATLKIGPTPASPIEWGDFDVTVTGQLQSAITVTLALEPGQQPLVEVQTTVF